MNENLFTLPLDPDWRKRVGNVDARILNHPDMEKVLLKLVRASKGGLAFELSYIKVHQKGSFAAMLVTADGGEKP